MKAVSWQHILSIIGFAALISSSNAQAITAATQQQEPSAQQQPEFVIVQPGQTLWRIAVNSAPDGVTPWQSLIALYKKNPKAFKRGDIHSLMAASRLDFPGDDQLTVISARRAKVEYDALVKSKSKSELIPELKSNNLLAGELQQQKKLQHELQQQVALLVSHAEAIEEQLLGLQSDNESTVQAQQVLQQENQSLVQGVAAQQQGLSGLNEKRSTLESNMLTLDQKFDAAQTSLDQTQADLLLVRESLSHTQQDAESVQVTQENNVELQRLLPILALLLIPVVLVLGFIWWVIGRARGAKNHQPIEPTVAVVDEVPVLLDTLSDSSFIEQFLQEQGHTELEGESMRQTHSVSSNGDQAYLSSEVEAMLHYRKQPQAAADEPVDYLSPEEDMNTKLDLARSYRDMGQISDAQAVLNQVLRMGNTDQKAQATFLLSSLK